MYIVWYVEVGTTESTPTVSWYIWIVHKYIIDVGPHTGPITLKLLRVMLYSNYCSQIDPTQHIHVFLRLPWNVHRTLSQPMCKINKVMKGKDGNSDSDVIAYQVCNNCKFMNNNKDNDNPMDDGNTNIDTSNEARNNKSP